MKFLSSKHRLDDEQEATTLEMPSSIIPITVASLLETNQNYVGELQKNLKKANQMYSYFYINRITIDKRHYNL